MTRMVTPHGPEAAGRDVAPGTHRAYISAMKTPTTSTYPGRRHRFAVGAVVALSLGLAGCAASSPGTLPVTVRSSQGPVLSDATCRPSGTGDRVVASGGVASPPAHDLTLGLAVYSPAGSPLDLEGSSHTGSLAAGGRRWWVTARIVGGFPPSRCVVTVTRAETLRTFRVTTSSMTPTAGPGDSVIVAVSGEPAPRTGDIVAFHPPTGATCAGAATVALGRVVGLPGQTVEGGHGSVLVDGRRLAQPWLAGSAAAATGVFGPVTVPNGDYYLLGDDRAHACDSRQLGPLPGSDLVGAVVRTVPAHPASGSATTHPTPTASTPAFTT